MQISVLIITPAEMKKLISGIQWQKNLIWMYNIQHGKVRKKKLDYFRGRDFLNVHFL